MFFKVVFGVVLVIGFGVVGFVSVQVEFESLDDFSVWGQCYLFVEEYEFLFSLWWNFNDDILLVLMQIVCMFDFSLVEWCLLRCMILFFVIWLCGVKVEVLLVECVSFMFVFGEVWVVVVLVF